MTLNTDGNQLKRLQEEVVDLEEMDSGISIMDLGLNEFRLDLIAYTKEHSDMDLTPFGMSAVVKATELVPAGVIFILKNRNNGVNMTIPICCIRSIWSICLMKGKCAATTSHQSGCSIRCA